MLNTSGFFLDFYILFGTLRTLIYENHARALAAYIAINTKA